MEGGADHQGAGDDVAWGEAQGLAKRGVGFAGVHENAGPAGAEVEGENAVVDAGQGNGAVDNTIFVVRRGDCDDETGGRCGEWRRSRRPSR